MSGLAVELEQISDTFELDLGVGSIKKRTILLINAIAPRRGSAEIKRGSE